MEQTYIGCKNLFHSLYGRVARHMGMVHFGVRLKP